MTARSNTCEGTAGDAVTISNSAGPDQFNSVPVAGTGAGVTYSSAQARAGSTCLDFHLSTNPNNQVYVEYSGLTATGNAYVRLYVYLTAYPTIAPHLWRFVGGGANCGSLRLNTGGRLGILNSSGTSKASPATSIPLNQWVRIEGDWTGLSGTTGNATVRFYSGANLEGTTPDDSATATGLGVGSATIDDVRIGAVNNTSQTTAYDILVDDIAYSDVANPGPAGGGSTSNSATGTAFDTAAAMVAGGVSVSATVTGPAFGASAAAPAGSAVGGASVTGPAFGTAAACASGTVSAGSSITGPVIGLSANTPAGSVSVSAAVTGPPFATVAVMPPGTVDTGSSVSVTGPAFGTVADMLAGAVRVDASVSGPAFGVGASAPAGTPKVSVSITGPSFGTVAYMPPGDAATKTTVVITGPAFGVSAAVPPGTVSVSTSVTGPAFDTELATVSGTVLRSADNGHYVVTLVVRPELTAEISSTPAPTAELVTRPEFTAVLKH